MSIILFFLHVLSWIFNKGSNHIQPRLTMELNNKYIIEMDVANFTAKQKKEILS